MCCNSSSECKGCKCGPAKIAHILVLVGGVNWGLVGLGMLFGSMGSWNLVNMIFGSMPVVEGIVYVLVGVSAVISIFGCKCKTCKGGVCEVGDKKMDASMPPKVQ